MTSSTNGKTKMLELDADKNQFALIPQNGNLEFDAIMKLQRWMVSVTELYDIIQERKRVLEPIKSDYVKLGIIGLSPLQAETILNEYDKIIKIAFTHTEDLIIQ